MTQQDFHKIFTQNYQQLCRFAYVMVKCKLTADEIVQKAFIAFWENRNTISINKGIKAYLYQSVKNMAINNIKSKATRTDYEQEYFLRINNSVKIELNEQAFSEKLQMGIAQLPEKCRTVYCLKYLEGLTYKEIATYLEISTNTVDNHIQKALKMLKEELGEYIAEFYNNETLS